MDSVDDPNNFLRNFKNTLSQLRESFETSVIIVSSLLPRKDRPVHDINSGIADTVGILPKFRFASNRSLTVDVLTDGKHLNREGFSVLLGNIRFMLFGKPPRFRQNDNYQQKDTRYRNDGFNHRNRVDWNNGYFPNHSQQSESFHPAGNPNKNDFG